jgi:hypothetical protein
MTALGEVEDVQKENKYIDLTKKKFGKMRA